MNLALFDFDGTITHRALFSDFMRHAAPRRRRVLGAILFAPFVIGYRLGWISGNTIRRHVVRYGFRHVPLARVARAGKRFASKVIPGVLRTEAMERIRWHKQQGDHVVVVSGALDVYLQHWCREHQLELICSRLEDHDGRLTGRFAGAQCVSAEKSRRILETYDLQRFPIVYAYGDTDEDLDMLALAQRRFFRWKDVSETA